MVANREWTNVIDVLNDFGQMLVEEYKDQLILNDVNASDELYNSVNYIFKENGGTFEVSLELADYWKYVENGRKAGKWPPISAIEKWIEIKPVIPRPMKNGKLPTTQQLAFLISRKIYGFITRNGKLIPIDSGGIKPRPILQQTIDEVWDIMNEYIAEAFAKDLETEIEITLGTLRG